MLKGVKLAVRLAFIIHLVACIWIFIGCSEKGWVWSYEPSKVESIEEFDDISSALQLWMQQVYYITTTMTTIGYGDILPTNDLEFLFVSLIQFFGIAVFSNIQ